MPIPITAGQQLPIALKETNCRTRVRLQLEEHKAAAKYALVQELCVDNQELCIELHRLNPVSSAPVESQPRQHRKEP